VAPGRRDLALYLAVAAVASLPFVRGLAAGSSFFFRDLSNQFFPLRSWAARGLARGELLGWNPLLNEGLALPVLWYPGDLLLAIAPDSRWFLSLVLALHLPLAAFGMARLARRLGLGRAGAAAAALCYALGGFAISSLSLYIFLQALAWAPLAIAALLDAAQGPWRRVSTAALIVGICLSTFAVELVAQAMLVGLVLSGRPSVARWSRLAAATALGLGLAAPLFLTALAALSESGRAAGFEVQHSLAFSVRPIVLVQSLVAGFFGPTETLTQHFFGARFTDGPPYILSLYLGVPVLAIAGAGAWQGRLPRRRLVVLAALALAICLGPLVRLDLLLEAVPPLRSFRFPVKAWYTLHLCISLLCGAGLDGLQRQTGRLWRLAGGSALALGLPLAGAPLLRLAPDLTRDFWRWLLPPSVDVGGVSAGILQDAARGGVIAALLGCLMLASAAGRFRRGLAVAAALVLVGADLLRAGAGINAMAPAEALAPSASARALADEALATGGRVFTCESFHSPRFQAILRAKGPGLDVWVVRARAEALTPASSVWLGVPTAYGRDVTGMVPTGRSFATARERACLPGSQILDRLRGAGTTRVISFEPLEQAGLERLRVLQPGAVEPLRLWVYALEEAIPRASVARRVVPATGPEEAARLALSPGSISAGTVAVEGHAAVEGASGDVPLVQTGPHRLRLEVVAETSTVVVVRDAWAPGWTAQVDGRPVPILRADGRHRAVPIGPGRSVVELRYRPPGLGPGLFVAALSLTAVAALRRLPRRAA
jgi:hypothetical protein